MPRASATKVHARILNCVAATSLDPVETTVAVDILDKMGLLDTRLKTKVGLHPQWVIDHAKGPIAEAIFAVNNCTEARALAEVARQNRRVTLAGALLGNPHLPETSCQELEDAFPNLWRHGARYELDDEEIEDEDEDEDEDEEIEDEQDEEIEDIPAHLLVPEKFVTEIFQVFDTGDPLSGLEMLVPSGVEPADVDDLIAQAMDINAPATAKRILDDYYGPAEIQLINGVRSDNWSPLWDLMTTHPTELLGALDVDGRKEALSGLVTELCDARRWSHRVPAHTWDHRLVAALIEADVDHQARANTGHSMTPCKFLSPRALRLVLEHPAWHILAQMHEPNSHDLKKILKSLDRDLREIYENPHNCSREMIATILAYKGPGAIERAFEDCELNSISRIFNGPDDPLFRRVLDIAYDSELIDYAFFGMRFQSNLVQHPPVEQIPLFAERINADPDSIDEVRELDVEMAAEEEASYAGAPTLALARALADHVRGAWEVLLESYCIGDVLISEIKNTGVPLHAAMAHLSPGEDLPAMTFPQVIEILNQAPRG